MHDERNSCPSTWAPPSSMDQFSVVSTRPCQSLPEFVDMHPLRKMSAQHPVGCRHRASTASCDWAGLLTQMMEIRHREVFPWNFWFPCGAVFFQSMTSAPTFTARRFKRLLAFQLTFFSVTKPCPQGSRRAHAAWTNIGLE
jgi:hypothetical protein